MRKAKPHYSVLALECFTQNGKAHSVTINQLEQFLVKKTNCSKLTASGAVKNLFEDGIIFKVKEGKKVSHGLQKIRFFGNNDIEDVDYDCYCFECYQPGELTNCLRCTRSFHLSCVRKNPERPNYVVPPTNLIDEFEDESDDESSHSSLAQQRRTPNQQDSTFGNSTESILSPKLKPCQVVLVDIMRSPSADIKTECDDKSLVDIKFELPDVICVGEVRPPTRQRANQSIQRNTLKNEYDHFDYPTTTHLCTCCSLLEKGSLKQPPNLLADEMHHLFTFIFKRVKGWIKHDIHKELENLKLSEKYINLLIMKLFQRQNIMSLSTINNKIKNGKYKLVVEILIDFLEFQFAIGVLFGSDSLIFDCSKYTVRDLSYEMAELRRCSDCYRYSNERFTAYWFTFPCVQRHELVFAKCSGHPFWPAKVVRVSRNALKYDVRFFGGTHERSVIDVNNIRAIDSLNIPFSKNLSFKEAMHELRCYQALAQFSPSRFGFHAKKEEILEIVNSVMGAISGDNGKVTNKIIKRRKTISARHIIDAYSNSEHEGDSEPGISTVRIRSTPKIMRLDNLSGTSSPISVVSTSTPAQPISVVSTTSTPVPKTKNSGTSITMEQHLSKIEALKEHHRREINALKKTKSYCFKCRQLIE